MYYMYLRKSRADRDAELRGEGETLSRHKKILTDLSKRMDISIPDDRIFSEVVSGETIADRPEIQRMLQYMTAENCEGVFVVEVERLARGNTIDQGIIAQTFKFSGAKIITPTKVYDPQNEYDEEYFEFGLFMSRREYKTINRRLQQGRIISAKEGKYIGSTAPYGYRRIKLEHNKGYTLEIIPEEADVITQIFDWYCNGIVDSDGVTSKLGATAIARKLDMLNIKPPLGVTWSKSSISDILSNPTYAGMIRFGYDREIKKMDGTTIVKSRARNENCILAPGLHKPIISKDLFYAAEKMRTINRKNTVPGNSTLQNPLSGLVYCTKCGALMTRLAPNKRNKYATLICPNRYCDNVSSPIFLVENQIIDFLQTLLPKYKFEWKKKSNIPFSKEIEIRQKSLASIKSEISVTQSQIEKTYTFLEQGIYTIDIFRERQATLSQALDDLKNTESSLLTEIEDFYSLQRSREQFIPKIENILDVYEVSSITTQNNLLKEVIEKISYEKTEKNTRGKLHNCNFTLNIYPKLP